MWKERTLSLVITALLVLSTVSLIREDKAFADVEESLNPAGHYVGLWNKPNGNGCDYFVKNHSGNVFTVKNYNESDIICSVPHPSSDNDWIILKKGITVNYNNSQGIYCIGDSPNRFQTTYPNPVNQSKYTLEIKCGFTDRWARIGVCFDVADENNYHLIELHYDRGEFKYILYQKIEDGLVAVEYLNPYPVQGNTDYIFKVKVNHDNNSVAAYVNGVLEWTFNLLYSPPSIIYVDDGYTSSTSGWQVDHFDSIQDGIDAVAENGTVFVHNGTYYDHINVNKAIDLVGENKNNTIIDGGGSGHIITISTDGVNINHFTIQNSGTSLYIAGIRINGPDSNTITNNIFTNCKWSMYLSSSSNNIISNNYFEYMPEHGENLRFQSSSNNNWFHNNTLRRAGIRTLYNCDFNIWENNLFQEGACVTLNPDGHYNTIRYNYFFTNAYCHTSQRSHYNEVYANIFINSTYQIADYQASHDNIIYHNNFINSSANCNFGGNYFYNTTLQEGNYWSDYTGTDSNGDGIGDTPYDVPGEADSQDLYPLIRPWGMDMDTIPPDTSCYVSGLSGCDGWFTSNVTITLNASDDISGVAYTRYQINNNTFQNYTGPFNLTSQGGHILVYFSVDNSGNIEMPNTLPINIDKSPPNTICALSPPIPNGNNSWYTDTVTVMLLNSDDGISGVNGTWYRLDEGEWQRFEGLVAVQDDGEHRIEYYSTDNACNAEVLKSVNIKIDKTKPVVNLIKPKEKTLYVFDRELIHLPSKTISIGEVTIEANVDDATSGIDKVLFYVDDDPKYTDTIDPYEWVYDEKSLLFRPHRVKVKVIDNAGNTKETGELDFWYFNLKLSSLVYYKSS